MDMSTPSAFTHDEGVDDYAEETVGIDSGIADEFPPVTERPVQFSTFDISTPYIPSITTLSPETSEIDVPIQTTPQPEETKMATNILSSSTPPPSSKAITEPYTDLKTTSPPSSSKAITEPYTNLKTTSILPSIGSYSEPTPLDKTKATVQLKHWCQKKLLPQLICGSEMEENTMLLYPDDKYPLICGSIHMLTDRKTSPTIIYTGHIKKNMNIPQGSSLEGVVCSPDSPTYTLVLTANAFQGREYLVWMVRDVQGCELLKKWHKPYQVVTGGEYQIPPASRESGRSDLLKINLRIYQNSNTTDLSSIWVLTKFPFFMHHFAYKHGLCGPVGATEFFLKYPSNRNLLQKKTYQQPMTEGFPDLMTDVKSIKMFVQQSINGQRMIPKGVQDDRDIQNIINKDLASKVNGFIPQVRIVNTGGAVDRGTVINNIVRPYIPKETLNGNIGYPYNPKGIFPQNGYLGMLRDHQRNMEAIRNMTLNGRLNLPEGKIAGPYFPKETYDNHAGYPYFPKDVFSKNRDLGILSDTQKKIEAIRDMVNNNINRLAMSKKMGDNPYFPKEGFDNNYGYPYIAKDGNVGILPGQQNSIDAIRKMVMKNIADNVPVNDPYLKAYNFPNGAMSSGAMPNAAINKMPDIPNKKMPETYNRGQPFWFDKSSKYQNPKESGVNRINGHNVMIQNMARGEGDMNQEMIFNSDGRRGMGYGSIGGTSGRGSFQGGMVGSDGGSTNVAMKAKMERSVRGGSYDNELSKPGNKHRS